MILQKACACNEKDKNQDEFFVINKIKRANDLQFSLHFILGKKKTR